MTLRLQRRCRPHTLEMLASTDACQQAMFNAPMHALELDWMVSEL
jgi:hypothetical protein